MQAYKAATERRLKITVVCVVRGGYIEQFAQELSIALNANEKCTRERDDRTRRVGPLSLLPTIPQTIDTAHAPPRRRIQRLRTLSAGHSFDQHRECADKRRGGRTVVLCVSSPSCSAIS